MRIARWGSDFVIAPFGGNGAIEGSMKRFLLVLLAIFAALGSASANLGDRKEKIDASYGKRIEMDSRLPGNEGHLYEKGGYTYMVVFREGVSVFEMYARANQAELSAKEIATFLKA